MNRSGQPDSLAVREDKEAVAMMCETVSRLIQLAMMISLNEAKGNEQDSQYLRSLAHLDRLQETVAEIPVDTLLALCEAIADDRRTFVGRLQPYLRDLARMEALETAEGAILWLLSRDRPN
jgi:hypothetical protein